MQSRRSSRDSNKSRSIRKSKDVTNQVEEISSQSYADDSGDHSRKSHKTARLTRSSKKEQRTDDDTEDYFSDIRRRKDKSSKKKTKSSESKESTEEILSDEEYAGKDRKASAHKKGRKRRKSARTNASNSHESAGDRDSSSKKSSAKSKRRMHQDSEKPSEVPITEILKKAQQQRTKYEEPAPLPELTASTVYVQDRNGFSAIKIPGKHSRRGSETPVSSNGARPIEAAIAFQKIWRSSGFIFQGLLAGMAMLHLIFMQTYYQTTEDLTSGYTRLVEIYASCFSFLIAMCLLATFDKFDLAHLGKDHLRQIFQYHLKSILALPLYVAAFTLHHVTSRADDKLMLLGYNYVNSTDHSYNDFNQSAHVDISVAELKMWKRMTLVKDVLAVLGWIFVSIGNREDMLLEHLQIMSKHAENGPM